MKKNLLLLGFALVAFGVNAQTTSSYGKTTHGVITGQLNNSNVHIGREAGRYYNPSFVEPLYNSQGHNVYVGHQARRGKNVDTLSVNGYSNVFVGYASGRNIKTGHENVFIGNVSGILNEDGNFNTFLGNASGTTNKGGNNNTFVGQAAGFANSGGSSNAFMGSNAGFTNVEGNNNTYLGSNSGKNNTGNRNVFIGFDAGANETNTSDKLYIANKNTATPLIYGEFSFQNNAALLKFNAKKVGIGYESGGFGPFPNITFENADSYRLFVRGGILATEVRVRLQTDWADYVFNKDYNLLSLEDTEKYIAQNGHLPNMPSAAQVAEEGIEMGNIAKLQQEKIEELTLHVIELNKQVEALKAQNAELMELKAKVEQLLKQK